MAIYLVHVCFRAFSQITLKTIGAQELWMHVLIRTLPRVSGPLVLQILADRFALGRGLGFGR